jgi:hypothetical protein
MGCLAPKAIERQTKGPKLHYYIFDVWAWDGISCMTDCLESRIELVNNMYNDYCDDGNNKRPNAIAQIDFATYYEGEELWEQLQKILAAGGEGIVMTKKGTIPSPGKRTARKTLKVKKELSENIDCFFTGRGTSPSRLYGGKEIQTWKYWENMRTGAKVEGELYKDYMAGALYEPVTKPYFYGWAGSLEIGVLKDGEVYPIGYLSGLADEVKADPGTQRMKCIEVTAMEILPDTGALRHGKLERFRPDLSPEDCTYEKYMRVE